MFGSGDELRRLKRVNTKNQDDAGNCIKKCLRRCSSLTNNALSQSAEQENYDGKQVTLNNDLAQSFGAIAEVCAPAPAWIIGLVFKLSGSICSFQSRVSKMLRSVTACDGKCYGLNFCNPMIINTCYDVTV